MRHAFTAGGRADPDARSCRPPGRTRLAAALAKNKMPAGALDRFKPFFASVTLASLQFGSMGMGAEQGAEAVIKRAVKGSAKRLDAVETIDEQFALDRPRCPRPSNCGSSKRRSRAKAAMAKEITAMLDAWNRGDAKAVAKMIQQSDKDSPALYKLMFTERNARWAQWVDRRLDRPGTVFMAVGAGHLAGDRSLVTLLKGNGHRVTRVQ